MSHARPGSRAAKWAAVVVILVMLLLLTLPAAGAFAATSVTLSGTPAYSTGAANASSASISNFVTGSGASRLMLVGISFNCNTTDRTILSVTFTPNGGSALTLSQVTLQKAGSNLRYVAIYSLLSPPSGSTGTVTVTFSGTVASGIVVGAATFAGVDQSTPLGTSVGATGTGNTSTNGAKVTLSSLTGSELVFDTVFQGAASTSQVLTPGSGQSALWNASGANIVSSTAGGASTKPAGGNTSVTMSWTAVSSSVWLIAAVPIRPATPHVTAVSPGSGPTTGGTSVTITGSDFTGATGVSFGGTAATGVTVVDDTHITCNSPAGSAGTVDVTVTTPDGTTPTLAADRFSYVPAGAPTVSSISPTSGPAVGGTTVTITGTTFNTATGVSFGATPASSFTINSDTQITATSPAGSGAVDVTVTNPGGISPTSSVDQFTYVPVPTVTAVSPTSGPMAGNTSVTITGTALTGATAVTFGSAGAASNVVVVSSTSITCKSPAGVSPGAADVTVTTPGGTSATSSADQFTYVAAPTVTAVSPTAGSTAGGTPTTITGTGFVSGATVSFGAAAATNVTVVGPTSITCTSPAHAVGQVDVTVTTPGGTSATGSGDQFTYVTPATVTVVQAVGQSDPTNSGPVNFTVVFGRAVTGFGNSASDVTLSGTAGGSLSAVVTDTGDGITYTVAVSGMSGPGTVIAAIPVGAAQDSNGVGNAASSTTDNQVTFDNVVPTATIVKASTQSDPTIARTIHFTVTFSKSVTGFTSDGVSLTGSDAPGVLAAAVSGSGTTYDVAVTGMTGSGNVAVSVLANAAHDAAGNQNTASSSSATVGFVWDTTSPAASIAKAAGQADPATGDTVNFTATFDKAVTGFTGSAVDLSASTAPGTLAATVADSGDHRSYTVAVTGMTASGTVAALIPAHVAQDDAGNWNTASPSSATVTCRYFGSGGTATTGSMDATGGGFSFAHTVGTGNNRLLLVGLSWNCGTTDRTATVTFTPSGGSAVTMTQVFRQTGGASGNPRYSAIYKLLNPPSGTGAVTVTFSGAVSNGAVGGAADFSGVDQTNPLGTAVGAASPNNTGTAVSVGLTGLTGNELVFDNVFAGATSGTTQALTPASGQALQWMLNIYSSGKTSNNVCGGASTRQATSSSGTMSWTAAAAAYLAVAAVPINPNTDYTSPDVSVTRASTQTDPSNATTIHFTATFNEPVTGFGDSPSDVAVSGLSGADTAVVNETAPHDGTTYDIAVTGMDNPGAVTVQIPAAAAQDLAGNLSNGSTAATVTYDNAAPTVNLVKASTQANPTNDSSIHFTATFSKPVTDFSASGVDLATSTAAGNLDASVTETDPMNGTTYDVAVSGMTGSGDVVAQVSADAAQDGLGNHNIASNSATVKFDNDAPTVGVAKATGQADPTSGSTINFTATFNEAVTGFDNSGVAFTGSTAGDTLSAVVTETAPNNGTTYNIAVSGMDHTGTVKATITDGAAKDLAGNSSQANSTGATVAYDITPPDVTIVKAAGQDDPTTAHTVHFTATFTKSVTGFGSVPADVTLTGSAGATTATVTGTGTTYDIAVTGMTGSGDVVAAIPAGAATDAAGNGNTASSTSASVTCRYFGARGTATSGTMDATGTTFSFAHTVGIGNSRLLLVGLSWNCGTTDRTATVTFTPSGGSAVPMTQVINQLGYNSTNPRHSAIYKLVDPPSGAGTVTVTFSGAVTNGAVGGAADFAGVDQTDPLGTAVGAPATATTGQAVSVSLTGLTGNELVFDNVFLGSGAANQGLTPASGQLQQWMVNTYGTGTGGTSNAVCGGSSTRKATGSTATMSWTAGTGAYWAIAAVPINPSADYTAPTVDVAKADGQADPTGTGPIHFTATFNEAVEGFGDSDVTLSGDALATTTAVTDSGDHKTYDIAVTGMATAGDVTVAIPAAAAQDLAGNASLASSGSATVSYDNVVPTATITKKAGQDDPTNTGPIDFTVVFSKSVSDFTRSDVDLSESTTTGTLVADVTESGTHNGRTYTVSVSGMDTSGAVVASIPAGAAHDLAGNGNLVSDDATVTYDVDAPTVTIDKQVGQADPAKTSPIHFTVIFSEAVTGFTNADVHLAGTSTDGSATITPVGSDNTTWTVSVSGMSNGTVIASIPSGVASDAAGNGNVASISTDNAVTYDTTAPSVTITKKSGQADPTKTSPIDFTVTFNEPVTGFAAGDVSLSGTAPGGLTAAVTGSGASYNVALSGMTGSGTVIAGILAGAATDAAGNSSTASPASATVTYDTTAPSVTIDKQVGQADPAKTSPIHFTVIFSEAVTGFTSGDVHLDGTSNGGSATITPVGSDNTTWTVSVSGMTDGTVIASILAGAATDAAGNASTASPASATVAYDATAPTVTINKKSGQADPTKDSPIDFTVTFSEPVSGFTADDLSFADSTTGGTLAGVLTPVGSANTTWTVAVSGMGHNGDVTVSVAAGAASDAAGNTSAASASSDNTVAYNATMTLAVTTGWNLVAAAPGSVFSDDLWRWNGVSFESVKDPVAWEGYWFKSTQDANVDMYTVAGPKTYDLADGWNLIGNSMATPATVSVPQGSGLVVWAWVVVSGNGSFQSVTTLQPGQGAWVKGTAGQQVTLTSSGG